MDQNRNTQNPDRGSDRNRSDQGGGNRDDQAIGQQRDRNQNQGGDRDVNDVNSGSRNRNQGDRSGGAGGSQTNR
jgi:hypothetical protein